MTSIARAAEVAAIAGDQARAVMLNTLMDGRALTATELANAAGITAQTASGHLARLTAAGLLAVEKQGRHRYHRLASPTVAHMLESIMRVAAEPQLARARPVSGPRDAALRAARTCYDHIAGRLGVALADAMTKRGLIELSSDGGIVTPKGLRHFQKLGIDKAISGNRTRRAVCRPCLDWSERRPHLAGALGAALCEHCFKAGWIKRIAGTRALRVTPHGMTALRDHFAVTID